jgi:hypothetical protein
MDYRGEEGLERVRQWFFSSIDLLWAGWLAQPATFFFHLLFISLYLLLVFYSQIPLCKNACGGTK